jgi:hypothetical protein
LYFERIPLILSHGFGAAGFISGLTATHNLIVGKYRRTPPYSGEQALAPLAKDLFTWAAWPAFQQLGGPVNGPLLALGAKDAYTLWRVLDIERIVTREDLLTLRALNSLGVLPVVNGNAVPADGRQKLLELMEKLSGAAYRADPESVVDLARAAAQWCLGVWFADREGNPALRQMDLGQLAARVDSDHIITKSMGVVLARLHSRAKPNEQDRHGTRAIRQGDAEFALAAVGMLLRELNWALD